MSKKRNVPELRIKGNMEEWKRSTFLDLFDLSIPNNTLSRADLNYDKGTIKNVHYGDVLINFGAITDASDRRLPFITAGKLNSYKDCLLKNGDIIIADTAEDETVGKATEIIGADNSFIVSGLHTIVCRPKIAFQLYFLGYYINSKNYRQQLLPLMQGIKVLSLSRLNLATTHLNYPDSQKEQAQIGLFFNNIDTLIALQQRKHEELCKFKKAMLEKMFPKENINVPEIRFKGSIRNWERKTLGDLSSLITKGTSPLNKNGARTINYVKIENIDILSGDIKISSKITKNEHENYLKRSKLKENDILFSIAGTLGRVSIIKKDLLPANTNQALAIIRLNSENISYVATFLKGKAVSEFVKKNPTVGAQPNLSLAQVGRIEIYLPSEVEQVKIASFIQNVESLISIQQQELDKLKNIKRACIEKMFV